MLKEKTAKSKQDPYNFVKNLVRSKISTLGLLVRRLKEPGGGNAKEIATATAKCDELEGNINQLKRTVAIVRANRQRYPEISEETLVERGLQVEAFAKTVNDTRVFLNSLAENVQDFGPAAETALLKKPVQEQDVLLESMKNSLDRLGVANRSIDATLTSHQKTLVDFEREMAAADKELSGVNKKVSEILGTPDRSTHVSVCMMLVAIIILLYTLFT